MARQRERRRELSSELDWQRMGQWQDELLLEPDWKFEAPRQVRYTRTPWVGSQ